MVFLHGEFSRLTLDKVANIALIVCCIIVSGHTGLRMYRARVLVQPLRAYKAGDSIKDTSELGLGRAPLTLLLGTRSSCQYCTASMPFYRNLVEVARQAGTRTVAITAEDLNTNRDYLLSHEVPVETVASIQKNAIKLRLTPTLILVTSGGTIVKSWEGELSRKLQGEVVMAVSRR